MENVVNATVFAAAITNVVKALECLKVLFDESGFSTSGKPRNTNQSWFLHIKLQSAIVFAWPVMHFSLGSHL